MWRLGAVAREPRLWEEVETPGTRRLAFTLLEDLDEDPASESEALFEALEGIERPMIFCFPNADAGNHAIRARATSFCSKVKSPEAGGVRSVSAATMMRIETLKIRVSTKQFRRCGLRRGRHP